jgi:hypothetical protein
VVGARTGEFVFLLHEFIDGAQGVRDGDFEELDELLFFFGWEI